MTKSQSAMEYLMTYGWAILIIAVILGALYQIGVFNPYTFSPKVGAGACKVARGIVDGQVTSSKVGTCNNALPQYVASFNQQNYAAISVPEVKAMAAIASGGGSITITAWAETPLTGGCCNVETPFGYYNPSDDGGITLINDGPGDCSSSYVTISMFLGPTGQYNGEICNGVLQPNRWMFYALEADGSTFYSYVLNPLTGTVDQRSGVITYGTNSIAADAPFAIGGDRYPQYTHGGGWLTWQGMVSDVQIYNKTLSYQEVNSLYQEGIGGVPIDISNLTGWWPLNGDSQDYSGNGDSGTAYNTVFTGSWAQYYSAP